MKISRLFIVTALLQGAALWWLSYSLTTHSWPFNPLVRTGALWLAIFVPLIIYWTHAVDALSTKTRCRMILGYAIAYGALGAYLGWTSGEFTRISLNTNFSTFAASAILCFVSVHLLIGFHNAERRWKYDQFFYYSWRNGMLILTTLFITAAFWAVLYAGAELMALIHIEWVRKLIQKPFFIYPITSLIAAGAFAFGLNRPSITDVSQRIAQTIASWLLILLLFFGVIWIASLPFAGTAILFSTQSTAFVTLLFAVLAIKLINCVYQDGRATWPYPTWLTRVIQFAWLSLLPIVGIGCWALFLRVQQYGWTPIRFWAALLAVLLVMYTVGYILAWLFASIRSSSSIVTIAHTNLLAAMVLCLGITAFLTPVADINRISVIAHMQKVTNSFGHAGSLAPDWNFLRSKSARFGREQLEKMAGGVDVPANSNWNIRAKEALAFRQVNLTTYSYITLQELIKRFTVFPAGQTVPAGFIGYVHSPIVDPRLQSCVISQRQCYLWIGNLKNDGSNKVHDIVFFDLNSVGNSVENKQGVLFSNVNNQWKMTGSVIAKNKVVITTEHLQQVQTSAPEWRDLIIAGERFRVLSTASGNGGS